jgi:hypothetical protein
MLLSSHIVAEENEPKKSTFDLSINLDGLNPTFEVHNYGNKTQVPLSLANILSLLHLFISKTKENNC